MSLFQRSDDNQKFLVTLNGYNNNLKKEKIGSEEDEEQLEMEVIFLIVCNVFSSIFVLARTLDDIPLHARR